MSATQIALRGSHGLKKNLPAAWKFVRLGDVCDHNLGKMLDRQKNKGTMRPYLRNPNVQWFDFDLSDLHEMPFEDHELRKYVLQAGDVVICEGGEAGRAAIWDGRNPDVYIQKALHRVRVGPELLNRYLVYQLMVDAKSGRLNEYFTGTTIPHFTGQDLDRYTFPLPPLPEQKQIADILDKTDAIRRKRRDTLDLTKKMPLAMFRKTFEVYLAGDAKQELLSDAAEVVSGIAKGRKLNGSETREVPYLRVANVQAGYLDLSEIKTIPAKESEVKELALQHGDVVMTEGGDHDKLGRGALWEHDVPDCIHQNHVFRVRTNRKKLLPAFFVHYLQTELAKGYFVRCAKKTTNLASINMSQLRALPVPLPPLNLQERFRQELETMSQMVKRQSVAENEAEDLFNSLVQRAFQGKL
jgi:type I restriction enzyme S subunit